MILIVGDDAMAEHVSSELGAAGADVRSVNDDSERGLREAGVCDALSILALSSNDERNLAVGLRARMLNPHIRVVLRQFSPKIGRKIEQNLPDCTVLSIAAHSAATFAGNSLDPGCFFAIRFPEADGEFVGFSRVLGREAGVAGLRVGDAEELLRGRIVALGEVENPRPFQVVHGDDELTVFSPVTERRTAPAGPGEVRGKRSRPAPGFVGRWIATRVRALNPIVRTILLGALLFYGISLLFFHAALNGSWESAAFAVAEIASNSGFGDASVAHDGPPITAGAILMMIGGTVFTSIFIGYVSSSITSAQWRAVQGLRRIRGRGHVVICGGGRTGGAVVNLLAARGKHVVVIDNHPDPGLIARSRPGTIDVLTGDATHDDVLEMCDVPHALAVMALTNSDPGNLEIALAARALRPDVPVVVRMENHSFAKATTDLFGIVTFSPAELTAPAFAGLARHPGVVGRVAFARTDHTIAYRSIADPAHLKLDRGAIPLCVWRGSTLVPIRSLEQVRSDDVVLYAQANERAGLSLGAEEAAFSA